PVMDITSSVSSLASNDREAHVPVAVAVLLGRSQARSVEETLIGGVNVVGLLAVVHLDPLEVARHRHHGARARKPSPEHAVRVHGLEAGVDGPWPFLLGPCGLVAPARELQRSLHGSVAKIGGSQR